MALARRKLLILLRLLAEESVKIERRKALGLGLGRRGREFETGVEAPGDEAVSEERT